MTKEELKLLKDKLKAIGRYRKILKEKSGYSFSLIDQVIRGDKKNSKVLDAAFDFLVENEEKTKARRLILNSN